MEIECVDIDSSAEKQAHNIAETAKSNYNNITKENGIK